ncbi:MAG: carbohydrate ABC transporter permease [Anaerolineae bacterium]|nr:carbohydrate ABC transporter permease [Anaerolineae bacterium]
MPERAARQFTHVAERTLLYLILIAGALVIVFPFYWMVSTSVKPADEVLAIPIKWIPSRIVWRNYPEAIYAMPVSVLVFLKNSLVLSSLVAYGTVLVSAIVAYPFARLRFRGRRVLFLVILATMMIPGQVTMIPLFILFSKLKWVNTFYPLVVPAFFGEAYFIFMLRQFFATIPRELDDAAKIDGCGPFGIFFRIIMPMSTPALGITAVFSFSGMWNNFMGPLIYLNDMIKFPLALGLRAFQSGPGSGRSIHWEHLMAASVLMTIPMLVLFYFTQRHYIQGIVITGVKG